ncbi:MAG: DUF4197 domain-containing protein [Thermodesulfovibrionales bacterium]
MKRFTLILLVVLLASPPAGAGFLDDLQKAFGGGTPKAGGLDTDTIVSGLKEALSIGTENAVTSVSRVDGYFGNQLIRILMPEKIRKAADTLSKLGFQREVDEFVLSMNRAAEKAAPQATSYFVDAIKQMSFEDARKILSGGDTAATEYFRQKTSAQLYDAFRPVVSSAMNEVGVTRSYKQMMAKYEALPFVDKQSLDLDHYVTNESLDGLFAMIGQEEKKIRTDPAARVTDLLKNVFGK